MLTNQQLLQCACILKEELIPAVGCTEPIAIAYAAAVARQELNAMPTRMQVHCSGNILKNVKSVIVPATKDLKGISEAAVLGAVGGNADNALEVLSSITHQHLAITKALVKKEMCQEFLLNTNEKLHFILKAFAGKDCVEVEIIKTHTGIVRIEKNGAPVFLAKNEKAKQPLNICKISLKTAIEYALNADLSEVAPILKRQVEYNTKISQEGLKRPYGAQVGKTLYESFGENPFFFAQACAAAGSDARMAGCELPVIINSGSGNQGLTVSLPVIVYANALKKSEEHLYRALCLSNLVSIVQKSVIGRLSAYCGAVSAAAGAGAGIMYLLGGNTNQIQQTITTTIANVSGIVCDGAKAFCAAKIASSVNAAVLAVRMTLKGRSFQQGEGLVRKNAKETIENIGILAREGMEITDVIILKLMLKK